LLFRVLFVIWTVIGLPSYAVSADVQEALTVIEKRMLCIVLLTNAQTNDQFGLPLQFEVDSEFYSRANRELYFSKFFKLFTDAIQPFEDKLTEDEQEYIGQKTYKDSMTLGAQWGAKATTNILSWDKPYRKCVADYGLAD
jgi:hypothetical protein